MGTILQAGPAGTGPIEQTALWLRPLIVGAVRALDRVLLKGAVVVFTWQENARQRHHLASLNDQALADMGLSPADVQREVDKPFWMN
jgi:uncharacterized protein YjiS (DUF1127 family)